MPVNQYQKKQDTSMSDAMNLYNAYKTFNDKPKDQPAQQPQDATQGSAVDSGKLGLPDMGTPANPGPASNLMEGPQPANPNMPAQAGMPQAQAPMTGAMQRQIAARDLQKPQPKQQSSGLGDIAGIMSMLA